MKKLFALVAALALLSGCGAPAATSTVSSTPAQSTSAEAQKPAILVVSFGTSYNETRAKTIEAAEKAIGDAFPDYELRRAFTSQIIIDKLKTRDGLEIDNVAQAMDRLVADGVSTLVVQPTHVMNGEEYDQMMEAVKPYEEKFEKIAYGKPLLSDDADYEELAQIIADKTAAKSAEDTAIVWMGHGTPHPANATYAKLQQVLIAAGHKNYIIGTVEATPNLDDVKAKLAELKVKKAVLLPLMIVAGDHANNDMAGDEADSWKTQLKLEGYEVECVLEGLGEYEGIQKMFVEHAKDAVDSLK